MFKIFWTERLLWGFRWAFKFFVVFGAFALLLFVFDGSQSFDAHGTSVSRVVEVYIISALAAGIILGISRPLLSQPVASAIAGMLVGASVGVAFAAFDHQLSWTPGDLFMPAGFALTGAVGGLLIHRRAKALGWLK